MQSAVDTHGPQKAARRGVLKVGPEQLRFSVHRELKLYVYVQILDSLLSDIVLRLPYPAGMGARSAPTALANAAAFCLCLAILIRPPAVTADEGGDMAAMFEPSPLGVTSFNIPHLVPVPDVPSHGCDHAYVYQSNPGPALGRLRDAADLRRDADFPVRGVRPDLHRALRLLPP